MEFLPQAVWDMLELRAVQVNIAGMREQIVAEVEHVEATVCMLVVLAVVAAGVGVAHDTDCSGFVLLVQFVEGIMNL